MMDVEVSKRASRGGSGDFANEIVGPLLIGIMAELTDRYWDFAQPGTTFDQAFDALRGEVERLLRLLSDERPAGRFWEHFRTSSETVQ
jgi:hypothetical protein